MQRNPQAPTIRFWPRPNVSLVTYVQGDRRKTLEAYRIKPQYIREHFDIEQAVPSSGYRYRQILEVVQNAADAILEAANGGGAGGRISFVSPIRICTSRTPAPR